jgi:multicomponent Na+:H+ antiporter subunit D
MPALLYNTLPALTLAVSLLTGIGIMALGENRPHMRVRVNLLGALLKLALVIYMGWAAYRGHTLETRFTMIAGLDFVLRADALSFLFMSLASALWLVTSVYAIGYLGDGPNRARFFGFFSICITAAVGVALAGNLITFFIFYELLTLSTYPLVVHSGSEDALKGGRTYLLYTIGGGALLFIGTIWLYALAGDIDFAKPDTLELLPAALDPQLMLIFPLLIFGVGVKAALFPMHGWLPIAMVAPAPVSALLHAVAVVKAGAFGVVRIVHHVYGIELSALLGLLLPLAILASLTIIYGSVRALTQDDLKKRLAYSTVSQVSYILLGVAIGGPLAAIGGLVHLIHQGIMKITLFFCAGLFAEELHVKKISAMNGIGRRMPWTMAGFTVGACGMIGLPLTAGLISKWYLGIGALEADAPWVIGVLLTSTLLNAGYFLPILFIGWFKDPDPDWPPSTHPCRFEANWKMVLPMVLTGTLSIWAGICAGSHFSPLALARAIVTGGTAP